MIRPSIVYTLKHRRRFYTRSVIIQEQNWKRLCLRLWDMPTEMEVQPESSITFSILPWSLFLEEKPIMFIFYQVQGPCHGWRKPEVFKRTSFFFSFLFTSGSFCMETTAWPKLHEAKRFTFDIYHHHFYKKYSKWMHIYSHQLKL